MIVVNFFRMANQQMNSFLILDVQSVPVNTCNFSRPFHLINKSVAAVKLKSPIYFVGMSAYPYSNSKCVAFYFLYLSPVVHFCCCIELGISGSFLYHEKWITIYWVHFNGTSVIGTCTIQKLEWAEWTSKKGYTHNNWLNDWMILNDDVSTNQICMHTM